MEAALGRIVRLLPRELTLCFAYGSGVVRQAGQTGPKVLDVVVAAPNALLFHLENMRLNPHHYSSVRHFGPGLAARVQESGAAGLYYNTLLPLGNSEGRMFKYGVVSAPTLIGDLLDWNALYLAGRLHKPVSLLKEPEAPDLARALRQNLHSALHAALLLLPETFSEKELYMAITNLSYDGDFRMIVGENPNKVKNIVEGQMELFSQLYAPVVAAQSNYVEISNGEGCQDTSATGKLYHLTQLPRMPQVLLARNWNQQSRRKLDSEDTLLALAHSADTDIALRKVLRQIVWNSSVGQALKGIITAGPIKSIKYSMAKIAKMWQKN
ncbi:phosphatidate cytidylyltransferase, mitochondrial [Cloeon dipterum]|uniref:phosphatidate cytidylyltransferase, mitochondrial n=1 Tax=Cloeon dipterum TaxID=197152 RepID=UPI00321FAFC2